MNQNQKKYSKNFINENEREQIIVEPSEIIDILKLISYDLNALDKIKKYRNKDIVVNGNLKLSGLPIKVLGNIKKVIGNLDVSNTKLFNIDGVEVTGYISDYGTPIERKRIAKIRAEKMASADHRREDDEWNPDIYDDEETILANALFEYLEGDIDEIVRPKNYSDKLNELQVKRSNLEYDQEQLESVVSPEYDEIQEKIDEIDVEIEELEDSVDVYFLIPIKYKHYGLQAFEVLIPSKEGEEYTVGTEYQMDRAIKEYHEDFINENGIRGYRQSFWEQFIDLDKIYDEALEIYETDVRDNPESYLSESDRELSEDQENEIEKLEEEKNELEERLDNMDSSSNEYDEIIDRLNEIEVEIDEINDSPEGEFKEESIEEKVEELADYYRNNADEFFTTFGYDSSDYVNEDELIEAAISDDGYGLMNHYDGNYDTIEYRGETYYIMRIT